MSALIGYDMVGPSELEWKDDVCLTRHIWVGGDAAVDILELMRANKYTAVSMTVYGQVSSHPRCVDDKRRPSVWEVWIEPTTIVLVHAGGTYQAVTFEADGEKPGPMMFLCYFDEALTRVRHTGTPV